MIARARSTVSIGFRCHCGASVEVSTDGAAAAACACGCRYVLELATDAPLAVDLAIEGHDGTITSARISPRPAQFAEPITIGPFSITD